MENPYSYLIASFTILCLKKIDKTSPVVNLTVNDELVEAGVLAVNLMKSDLGSGVREVDLYQVMPGIVVIVPFVGLHLCDKFYCCR